MIILTIRTDKPEAEIGIFEGNTKLVYEVWQAHRELAETLNLKIQELLSSRKMNLENLEGIVVYEGPGSFTGLRIGISVANALGYGLQIPVIGSSDESWIDVGMKKINTVKEFSSVLPEYGGEIHITKPKK